MFVISKRTVMIFGAFIILFVTLLTVLTAINSIAEGVDIDNTFKIVIDAGHGGVDGGVSGRNTGVKESEINLLVAKEFAKCASEAGFRVALTRSSSAGLYGTATSSLKKKDMQKRKEIILKEHPDIVVSIHMNYYSVSTRRGAQAFYKSGDDNGFKLATAMQNNFNSLACNVKPYSPLCGDYYILNCTDIPSVIVECGFLSNPEDEMLLNNENYRKTIAETLTKGVVEYTLSLSA